MSSLAISITETEPSCSPAVGGGDSKRIFGAPGLRVVRNSHAPRASQASSAGW